MTHKQLTKFLTDHAVDEEVDSRVDGDKNVARLNQMTSNPFQTVCAIVVCCLQVRL